MAWIALWIIGSVFYRRSRGLPVLPRRPKDAFFYQDGASGRSMRNLLTRLGGARNCLTVAVTPTRVIIRPFLPFNLMFLPEIYDLEHDVPRTSVRIETRDGFLGQTLRLDFRRDDGRDVALHLKVRHSEDFVQAVRSGRLVPTAKGAA